MLGQGDRLAVPVGGGVAGGTDSEIGRRPRKEPHGHCDEESSGEKAGHQEAGRKKAGRQERGCKEVQGCADRKKGGANALELAVAKNQNKPWTDEEDRRLMELKAAGRSAISIGASMKRSTGAVEARASLIRTQLKVKSAESRDT